MREDEIERLPDDVQKNPKKKVLFVMGIVLKGFPGFNLVEIFRSKSAGSSLKYENVKRRRGETDVDAALATMLEQIESERAERDQ